MADGLALTGQEKRSILAGTLKALVREAKPDLSHGKEFDVAYSRPHAYTDPETKHVFRPPPERVVWITITNMVRRTKGGWSIHFSITDNRETHWRLKRGGGYTTDPEMSIDHLEAHVDAKTQARLTIDARQTNADRRARDAELAAHDRRRQERAFRDRLREAMRTLDPTAQTALLAALQRELEEAGAVVDEAA